MGRIQLSVAGGVLMATCTAGALHWTWWWACASACSLALISLLTLRAVAFSQLRSVSEPILVASSLLNASAAASAAFMFGYAARWMWGL